jgi:UDP-N-acetylglucosamine 2-epimerase (non-hydrolysing)
MIDTLYYQFEKLAGSISRGDGSVKVDSNGKYGVITLHRPSNVDDKENLHGIMEALTEISKDMPFVFPIHPRTKKNFTIFGLSELINESDIRLMDPLSYMEFLNLWKDADAVFTDSGGYKKKLPH